VLGFDISQGRMEQTLEAGPSLQAYGVPPTGTVKPDSLKWAVFANDTLVFGNLALTLGLRYDDNDQSGSFTSPSLGATYQAGEHTVLRVSVARGFTSPPLSMTSGGALFLDPNPDLKPEAVWSYQAGIESSLSEFVWVKATAFRHELKDALYRDPYAGAPPVFNDIVVNTGDVTRRGIELQGATVPIHNVSLTAGWCYVERIADIKERVRSYMDEVNLGLKYDDRKAFLAQVFGHRVHWDVEDPAVGAKDGTFLWDFNVRYKLPSIARVRPTIFASVHNLFDEGQYSMAITKNPGTWFEAGLACEF
jgi:vitamin B12 transporter